MSVCEHTETWDGAFAKMEVDPIKVTTPVMYYCKAKRYKYNSIDLQTCNFYIGLILTLKTLKTSQTFVWPIPTSHIFITVGKF